MNRMPEDKRRARRVATELKIRLAYGSVDDFIEGWALNLARGGVFVQAPEALAPGTEVALDIALESGDQVIRGRGVVRWTAPPAPGEPAGKRGMGIKFTELSRDSRALVDLIVATVGQSAKGEEPPVPEGVEPSRAPTALREPAPTPIPPTMTPALERPATTPAPAGPAATAAPPAPAPPAVERAPVPSPTRPAMTPVPPIGAKTPPPTAPAAPAAPAQTPFVGAVAAVGPKPRRTGPVIGIDLGTTNTCAAISRGGKAEVIASKQGYRTIPSVVAYDSHGRLLVGPPAKAQMAVNPQQTVYGSKRLVGRPFASPTVQACRDRFHYEIVASPEGDAAVRFAGADYSLQRISALILREIREMASEALGERVERAVVTVPAYYNDHQRSAVREAGALAGLDVERMVNEPTAAALAFGYGRGLDKRVLVYDLGGGTFDASVLEIQGDVYEVISTGGDTFLGGVDFDGQLVDHLAWKFAEQHGFSPPPDRVAWQRIGEAAEAIKVELSSRERAVAHVPYLCRGEGGKEYELKVEVTRAELEELTGRLVDRTIEVCREVLAAKGLAASDIQEVLLVGGQSRMPLVWRRIQQELGREPNKSVHPDEAVALGAALLADSASRIDSVVLIDVLAMGIGVGLPGGRIAPILQRNTKLPAKKAYALATTHDGQTELELQVFQGDSPKVSECEYLGTVRVAHLPARRKGEVKVAVEFAVGGEGLLKVTAQDLATDRITEAQFATLDTPESLRKKLEISEPQTAPKGARPLDPQARRPEEKKGLFKKLFGTRT